MNQRISLKEDMYKQALTKLKEKTSKVIGLTLRRGNKELNTAWDDLIKKTTHANANITYDMVKKAFHAHTKVIEAYNNLEIKNKIKVVHFRPGIKEPSWLKEAQVSLRNLETDHVDDNDEPSWLTEAAEHLNKDESAPEKKRPRL